MKKIKRCTALSHVYAYGPIKGGESYFNICGFCNRCGRWNAGWLRALSREWYRLRSARA